MDHVNQQPVRIQNPILPGFHPDPSVVRVGDTYYLAVSTFQWFPGVAVYQSRDLAHWSFAAFPLTRESQLPLRGVPDSCGIFAPCLSWDGGTFYLVYTVVKTDSVWQDTDNYLVTASEITGPWSEPVYLNSAGFDPSLFHDADGRKWLVNRDCDTRGYLQDRGGILLREYDPAARRLTGPEYRIYRSTKIIGAEGPHLYRKDGWYYLLLAEGGTDWNHVATLARSESLFGPYTCAPNTPFLTSRDAPELPLQKAGHGCLVETPDGRWYLTHLVGRPLPGTRRCVLGRETALQEVRWTEAGGSSMLAVSKSCANPELAMEFIAFMYTPENDQKMVEMTASIPSGSTTPWPDELVNVQPVFNSVTSILKVAGGIDANADIKALLSENVIQLCAGKITADQFVENMVAATKQ